MSKWEKILYRQQNFPDNYSGGQEQFLRELRKNVSAVQYKYLDAVVACCNFVFHINCVILFYVVYKKVEDGLIQEETLLLSSYVSLLALYTIYSLSLAKGEVNFRDHLFTMVTLNFYGFALTPIIRTLTTTISTDTVYATSIFTAAMSCVFHDYGAKAPIVSMPLSVSSGLCSAIFLLSRLKSNSSAFALLSSAFALHACSPFFRNVLFFTLPLTSSLLTMIFSLSLSVLMSYPPSEGPPAKRAKPTYIDVETPPEFYNTSNTPSKVIHIADLSTKAQDPDLLEAFARFGRVSYIVIKRQQRNIALLEYEAVDGASSAMLYVQTTPIYICSQKITINYSALEKIPRFGFETDQPNKVLVLLVTNVQFNVNAHTLYDICKPHGAVLRIAVVKRTPNITALVEFETVEAARNCKFGINGADIYTNCCTLKVEYAKIPTVRILYPDEDHVDFTQPLEPQSTRKTLMGPSPEHADIRQVYAPRDLDYRSRYNSVSSDSHFYEPNRDSRSMYRDYPSSSGGYQYSTSSRYGDNGGLYADPRQSQSMGRLLSDSDLMRGGAGCVLLIGGIDQTKMNCDRLFNLLCIYGNVLRVMFMKKKTELALVEMGTSWQAREAINNLKRIEFLGMDIEVSLSNQNCVNPIHEPFPLPDGSISFKDFNPGRLNRYMTRDHAGKNRPCQPQPSLHWFNAPPEMNEEKLANIFKDYGAPAPYSITLHRLPSGRSTAGTAEFSSVREATEALVLANHAPVETPSTTTPFVVKLAYTKARGHKGSERYGDGDHW